MTISEAATETNLTIDTLRYYEKIGLVPRVARTSSKIRNYQEKDIAWIKFVRNLKSVGLSINDIIKYVELVMSEKDSANSRYQILLNKKKELNEKKATLENTLKYLDYKMAHYEDIIRDRENELLDLFKGDL